MINGIIKEDGTSRRMRATLPATYEEFRAMAAAGTLTLDILFNALGWSQLPTFLDKDALLKDATAALFGLGTDAVPDDVLALLGRYNQHWWRRTSYGLAAVIGAYETFSYETNISGKTISECLDFAIGYSDDGNTTFSVEYADTVEVDKYGVVHLINPKTAEVDGISSVSTLSTTIRGKYYQCVGGVRKASTNAARASVEYALSKDRYYLFYVATSAKVTGGGPETKTEEFLHSSDRSAYPDSGGSGGYEYEYLGKPFDNAVTAPKIAIGSYIGTGLYGTANPNSLTFEFIPKIVIVHHGYQPTIFVNPATKGQTWEDECSGGYYTADWDGTTLSWWVGAGSKWYGTGASSGMADGHEPDRQLNQLGAFYHYIAIC